jgi:hypothetical protein
MTINGQPPTGPQPGPVVNPLQWQLQHGTAPDGTKICVLMLMQGALNVQLAIAVHDMGRLAAGIDQMVKQAQTGLIIPDGARIDFSSLRTPNSTETQGEPG